MSEPLWAPWRMEYVLGQKQKHACVFCLREGDAQSPDQERLVVVRAGPAVVLLNRYPFTAGHLLVVPTRHASDLGELAEDEHTALWALVREAALRLRRAVDCAGLNVGLNLGAASGAGIAEHLHVHVVPRWPGDTNFMPVVADTRVVPQALDATRAHLRPFFADLERPVP